MMNIVDLIHRHAGTRPEALALTSPLGHVTWLDFDRNIRSTAAFLISQGLGSGQCVGITLRCQVLHLYVSLALARIGAVQIALPVTDTTHLRENLASRLSLAAVVVERPEDGVSALRSIVLCARDISQIEAVVMSPSNVAGHETWLLLQSSGTTGDPKFAELTHDLAMARFKRYTSYFDTSSRDVFWPASRLDFVVAKQRVFHSLQAGAGVCLTTGMPIDPTLIEFIDNSNVTLACGTPSHVTQIVDACGTDQSLPRLRAFEVRSATVPEVLRAKFRDIVSPNLYIVYATNEAEAITLASPELQMKVQDTVGRPVAGLSLQVVDRGDQPVQSGEAGLVRLRGPGVVPGYLDNPEATKKSFRDGWFYPGDMARYVDDALVFLGRSDDMMIFDGMNIYPVEIENALMEHPAVREVASFPLKHQRFQDVPVAAVVLNRPVDIEDLNKHCERVLGLKRPRMIKAFDIFPVNAMGKTIKRDLRKFFLEPLDSSLLKQNTADKQVKMRAQTESVARKDIFSLKFKCPEGVEVNPLDAWLSYLGDPLFSVNSSSPKRAVTASGQLWLEQVLSLVMALFHVLRIPVFDPIEVIECRRVANQSEFWEAVCRAPDPSLLGTPVLEGVIKVAFKLATWACKQDATSAEDRDRFFQIIEKNVLRAFAKVKPKGKSTFEVLRAAHHLGVPYIPLPGGAFQLGWGSKARRIDRSTTNHDSAMGMRWTQNKLLTAQLLSRAGLPAATHLMVENLEQARQAAERIGYPVVIKPADLERGEGVRVDVRAEDLDAAFSDAHKRSYGKMVLVEQQVPGVCYRLFIASGKLLYAVRRLPIGVYADGHSTIRALVASEWEAQQRVPPWKRSPIQLLDDMALNMLLRQGWGPDSIPDVGQFVPLRRIETTVWGGVDEEVTKIIHPDNVSAATAATKLFGLEVAGVDMISSDIQQPWHANGAIINEVNYAPLLGDGEISRSHIQEFLSDLIEGNGRIPVHVYLGGTEALKLAEGTWRQLVEGGTGAVFASSDRMLTPSGEPWNMPLGGLYARCRALVLSTDVDALVLVVQTDEFLQTGLPLESITSLHQAGSDLISFLDGRSLDEAQANRLSALLRAWPSVPIRVRHSGGAETLDPVSPLRQLDPPLKQAAKKKC